MKSNLKHSILSAVLISLLFGINSCNKQLDINSDPSNPDNVEAALWLNPILARMGVDIGYDARYLARYEQFFQYYSGNTAADRMGYYANSDAMGQIWRMIYFDMGENLNMMIKNAMHDKQWDYVGVGKALWAWGYLVATDYHGPIAVKLQGNQDPSIVEYDYDSQEFVYQTVFNLCDTALLYLNRTDDGVSQTNLARGDNIYHGDRTKWIKFVYGLKARAMESLSNKSSKYYNPDQVIEWVDKALASNDDNARISYADHSSADANFLSPTRDNFGGYRQSAFIVQLMDSTVFGTTDPRMPKMLVTDMAGTYRGVTPIDGDTGYSTNGGAWRLKNPYDKNSLSSNIDDAGHYVFAHTSFPIMTYAELQFCKAEAAYIKGDMPTALEAYTAGIKGDMIFCGVNPASTDAQTYLNDPKAVPTDPAKLTLSMIMCQKFIALWGYGYVEAWTDLRKYHYTDLDPKTNEQVFSNFTPPSTGELATENDGKLVYRVRPRYNSEYVWNLDAIKKIGADKLDYHTEEMWFSKKD